MRQMEFPATFAAFAWSSIEVIDTVGRYDNGVWVERMPLGAPRTIKAIPFAEGSFDLSIYPDGSASEGTTTFTTAATLYYTDITSEAQEQRQSYINWQGYTWRVKGKNLFLGNVFGLMIYKAERYIR